MLKIWGVLTSPRRLVASLGGRGYLKWMPDALYLKIVFPMHTGYKLDLKKPKTFNEKLQWLKLYDRNPAYTQMVDKYGVREYIAKKIGEEYLIPLLGVWDRFEDIDFSQLPDQFVLKCNHDGGSASVFICKDKDKLDVKKVQKKISKSLKRNFYYSSREWPYKNVKPRIIVEKYMVDESGELRDYKVLCFNGKAKLIEYHSGRFGNHTQDFYDIAWTKTNISQGGEESVSSTIAKMPQCLETMLNLSEKLAAGIPHVRIDWYIVQGKLYFGEITFFDGSGYCPFDVFQDDLTIGSWIKLSYKN